MKADPGVYFEMYDLINDLAHSQTPGRSHCRHCYGRNGEHGDGCWWWRWTDGMQMRASVTLGLTEGWVPPDTEDESDY